MPSIRSPDSRWVHWEGNALVARTTHVKAGFIRKTGVPLTDNAIIDWHFYRHGDVVTVLMVATDPVYLVERKSFRKASGCRARRSTIGRSACRHSRTGTRRKGAALPAGSESVRR